MINIKDYSIFKNNISTLKETSLDKDNKKYLTTCEEQAICFDDVVKDFCADLHLPETPESIDALFINSDNHATFIEFKNGFVDKKTQYQLLKKIYDSVCILSTIMDKSICFFKEHLDYILVYNGNKNNNIEDKSIVYRESKSRDIIDCTIAKYAKKKYIRYGLDFFENYCFNSVFTYDEEEFTKNFLSKL